MYNSEAQRPYPIVAALLSLIVFSLTTSGCGGWWNTSSSTHAPPVPEAQPIPSEEESTKIAINYLEDKIKRDPEDYIAYNKLAGYYLGFLRETGNLNYLELASRAAHKSLDVLPAEQNGGGLAALAQVEFASHDFADTRDHAQLLARLDDRKSYPFGMLGDAYVELGEYDRAAEAFRQMEERSGGFDTQTRQARLALLNGEVEIAQKKFALALSLLLNEVVSPREAVAWCRWQLGEAAFSIGDYETAEKHYRDALTTFPDYYRALASLGRVRAARGDLAEAIQLYEHVTRILPDPTFVAALGDLYKLAGREKESDAQYALVEQIGHLSALNGALYNRQLALFYADHDMKAEEAYQNALREFEARKDIYGSDAVAWTALKAGKLSEAEAAIKEAMRLGTRDARLLYHAGMIARAAGDKQSARDYLKRALALNPVFDPLQASVAGHALEEMGN